ncbi:MAG: hypothetical protein Q7T85_10790 [Nitrosomonas sp.]|nr:hypothetical protein [Nitrosomonas sp.]
MLYTPQRDATKALNYNTKKFSIKDKVALELTSRITGENEFIPKPAKKSHDQVTPCRKKMQTKKIPILNLNLAGSIILESGFLSKSYTLQPIKKALIKFVLSLPKNLVRAS